MSEPVARPEAPQPERAAGVHDPKRLENLRAVYAGLSASPEREKGATDPAPSQPGAKPSKRRGVVLGALGAAAVFIATKLKFVALLAGVLKLKTLATMLLSVGVYALEWGLPFAVGLVLLIFVHELGHVIVLKREGIPATAPVFIPFLGAFIAMRGRPRDAYVEAKVALGGPVLGSLAAWGVMVWGHSAGSPMIVAIGQVGVMLNLFNLIPVSPLDGGRIAGAFSRVFWIAAYGAGILAWLILKSPLLLIVLVVGLFTMWHRWRNPVPGYDAIPPARRVAVGAAYALLVLALVATLPGSEHAWQAATSH